MRRKKTILLVDADDHQRSLRTFMLQTRGFRVIEASDSLSAIYILELDEEVDLMLTDLKLTGPDGEELAREAKEVCPSLPVIIVSKLRSMPPQTTNANRFLCGHLGSPVEVLDAIRLLMPRKRRKVQHLIPSRVRFTQPMECLMADGDMR